MPPARLLRASIKEAFGGTAVHNGRRERHERDASGLALAAARFASR
jgi:hypothetical protein